MTIYKILKSKKDHLVFTSHAIEWIQVYAGNHVIYECVHFDTVDKRSISTICEMINI